MAAETELERLVVRLVGDASSYMGMLSQAQTAASSVGGQVSASSLQIQQMGAQLKNWSEGVVSQLMGVAGIAVGLTSIFKSVSMASEFEKNEVAFGTMLQDMERGKELMKDLSVLGAKTPLNLPDLQNATKILLQFGVQGDDVVDTLRMLGDSVNGNAQRLQSMALAFGQAKAAGRLMGNDVFQMINAGFNPLQETAEYLSKTVGGTVPQNMQKLKQSMERGQFTIKMMEDSFKRATSEGGRFFNGMENASKTLDGLFSTMQDDLGAFMRQLGGMVAEALHLRDVMKGVSAAFQAATSYIDGLSPAVKTTITLITSIGGAIVTVTGMWPYFWRLAGPAITNVWTLLRPFASFLVSVFLNPMAAIRTIIGLFSGFTGPIGLIIGLLALLGTVWVQNVGGLAKAWTIVSDAAVLAWKWIQDTWGKLVEWLKPITNALGSFFTTAWKKIVDGVNWAWGKITEAFWSLVEVAGRAWKAIGGADIDWGQVRDAIRDAILFAEFTLDNFGEVAALVWAGAIYHAVKFGNETVWVFTDLIPAGFRWLLDNFFAIHEQMLEFGGRAYLKLGELVVTVFNAIPWRDLWSGFRDSLIWMLGHATHVFENIGMILAGAIDPKDIWKEIEKAKPPSDALKNLVDPEQMAREVQEKFQHGIKPFQIPDREIGELEKRLKDEYEKLGAGVAEKFGEFRDRKLREWEDKGIISPELSKKFREPGHQAEEGFKGAEKALHDYDASLLASAQAITHIQEYLDRLKVPGTPGGPLTPSKPGEPAAPGGFNLPPGGRIVDRDLRNNADFDYIKDLQTKEMAQKEAEKKLAAAQAAAISGEGTGAEVQKQQGDVDRAQKMIDNDLKMIELLRDIREQLRNNPTALVPAGL